MFRTSDPTAGGTPPGSLRALHLSEGDLVGVRLTSDGVALLRVDDIQTPPADIGSRILAQLMADPDLPADIDELIWQLCADDPGLLRTPLPPLKYNAPLVGS